jgi:predicted  nucleic acid-binding Zn-ribbon protein
LITEVKTKSDAVSTLQVQYQTKLNDYNTKFDSYIEAYNQWNNLVDSASNLIESTTSYVDLLRARITLTAEVAQLRAKFNSDVTQIKTTVAAIQQTYLNLKAQGIRTIPTSSTSTTVNISGINYQKRSQTTFPIVNLLNFVPK